MDFARLPVLNSEKHRMTVYAATENRACLLYTSKADAHERKSTFQIVSRFDVVTRKAGKVLDADQIDFAVLDLLHHLRELRTVKVRAGITAVSYTHLDVYKRQKLKGLAPLAYRNQTLVA